ncbi:WAT1-related protein [Quillaja saponaria]|uniref:WAT1-related protein n=1 Tax=Quillaja saponaria TaxID=32244 RepID=A0AAD7VG19_QUISA|nr:WAT1-related protein [Quillaja saponaria]
MENRFFYRDVLPFTAMIAVECTNVGLNTLFKAATTRGMSYYVFVAYSYVVAAIVLLPAPFISQRSRVLPRLNFSILSKIGLLGLIGSACLILGFAGINYSSPTLSSAMSNLVPAFTFLLAIIFRMEKIALKSTSSQAKILGTIVSIGGAFVVTLYKGPPIITQRPSSAIHISQSSLDPTWIIGGLTLTAEYILVPMWYILQAQIMKEYPNELTAVFFYNLYGSVIAAMVGLVTETNPSAWRIRPNIALASIVCSGIFGSFLNNAVHSWALRIKGPVYVAMFKPISIAIAVAMGAMFLGDYLHLGSLVGATIISIGFYTVMWGKATEEKDNEEQGVGSLASTTTQIAPLLQSYKSERAKENMHIHV